MIQDILLCDLLEIGSGGKSLSMLKGTVFILVLGTSVLQMNRSVTKTTQCLVWRHIEDSDQPGHQPSLCALWVANDPNLLLIRLSTCSGWTESSLDTQVIFLVLSWSALQKLTQGKLYPRIFYRPVALFQCSPACVLVCHVTTYFSIKYHQVDVSCYYFILRIIKFDIFISCVLFCLFSIPGSQHTGS